MKITNSSESRRRLPGLWASVALALFLASCTILLVHWYEGGRKPVPPVTSASVTDQQHGSPLDKGHISGAANSIAATSSLTTTTANGRALDAMSAEDILARVQSAMKSQSVEVIIGATYFLDPCLEKISNPAGFGNIRPLNLPDGKVRQFEESNRALKERCNGLLRIRLDDLLTERKRWLALLDRETAMVNNRNLYVLGGGMNSMAPRMHESARELLLNAGPDLFFWAPEAMAEIVTHQSEKGVFTGENPLAHSSTITMAFELARCELGFDCGSTSFRTLTFCSGVGACANGLRQAVLDSLTSDTDRLIALAQAKVISEAVKGRNASALGLAANQYRDGSPGVHSSRN